jgi:hypothetical protein
MALPGVAPVSVPLVDDCSWSVPPPSAGGPSSGSVASLRRNQWPESLASLPRNTLSSAASACRAAPASRDTARRIRSAKMAQDLVLTEAQIQALERPKVDKEAHGEFESECPGYCGAQDTFYVGTLKGVGRIYQQTFIDTYAKVASAKLYDRK